MSNSSQPAKVSKKVDAPLHPTDNEFCSLIAGLDAEWRGIFILAYIKTIEEAKATNSTVDIALSTTTTNSVHPVSSTSRITKKPTGRVASLGSQKSKSQVAPYSKREDDRTRTSWSLQETLLFESTIDAYLLEHGLDKLFLQGSGPDAKVAWDTIIDRARVAGLQRTELGCLKVAKMTYGKL